MALLLAVFALVLVSDALLCSADDPMHAASGAASDAFAMSDADASGGVAPDLLQGHCEHGHCHHLVLHPGVDNQGVHLVRHRSHEWPSCDGMISYAPDGLMRPPKA